MNRCCILFVLMSFYSYCNGQKDSANYVITTSQQFDFSLSVSKDSEILSDATKTLKEIILNRDSSAFLSDNQHDVSREIFRQLLPNLNPLNTYEYHLLSIAGDAQNVDVKLMLRNNLSSYGYKDMLIILAIYNVHMIKVNNQWLLDCSLQSDNMYRKKIGNITFYARSQNETLKPLKKSKLVNFQKHIFSVFRLNKKEISNLYYFVGNRLDGFAPLGFDYSIETTGMYLRKANILLNVTENPLDKHELTHYFLKEFQLKNKFINEGIAVYYGGSNGYQPDDFKQNERKKFTTLTTDVQLKIISAFLDGKILPEYLTAFYFLSYEIINIFVQKQTESHLYDLVTKYADFTPKQLIGMYDLFPAKSVENSLLNYIVNGY